MSRTKEVLTELASLGNEKTRKQNSKQGAHDNQYGVKLGDIRKLAKKIGLNKELALELWESGNIDARFLAILLLKTEELNTEELNELVSTVQFGRVCDWLNAYIFNKHSSKEQLAEAWINSSHPMTARSAWSIIAEKANKKVQGLDIDSILGKLESEMKQAHPDVQWTMNFALSYIGINYASHRDRAIAIGEDINLYADYPTPKGCTSPHAPTWIREMVSRQ
jgi:3-methyladenine DNA glycosylase AlkD